jgi:hypothetical protein
MGGKFGDMKAFIQKKAEQASQSVTSFVEHENTKAAVAWSKEAAHTAADEAVKLGKRAAQSEMAKDAATGAAIGAAVAVPIPIIGPIFGAVVGAGAGMAMNLKSGGTKSSTPSDNKVAPSAPDIDIHKRLIDLDDLRQKGILTQEEFDAEKRKLLDKH